MCFIIVTCLWEISNCFELCHYFQIGSDCELKVNLSISLDVGDLILLVDDFVIYSHFSYTGRGGLSGFGFELTFRLKKAEADTAPPMWPTTLLNKLAAYVFHTGVFDMNEIFVMNVEIVRL